MGAFSINVLIADDHPAILLGIASILEKTPSIYLVGQAKNSSELVEVLEHQACSVLVTDYAMPGGDYGDGAAMLALLARRFPELRLVVMTTMDNAPVLRTLLAQGVRSIISKSDDLTHLVPAIHAAFSGGRHFSPAVQRVLQTLEMNAVADATRPLLSQREAEVVRLFVSGLTVNEIAAQLSRSKQTVSTQKASAMRKLGIQRDADLYKYALEIGMVSSASHSVE